MASYSALGRIMQVIVFDSKNTGFSEEIAKEYEDFAVRINANRKIKIRVVVFVKEKLNNRQPQINMRTPTQSVTFIGLDSSKDFQTDIDTFWTQDVFVITHPDHAMYYLDNRQYAHVFNSVRTLVPRMSVTEWNVNVDGGNLLLGKLGGEDYLLVGLDFPGGGGRPKYEIDTRVLEREFNLNSGRAIRLLSDYFYKFYSLFYHADIFCTIAGPDSSGHELILFANIQGVVSDTVTASDINQEIYLQAELVKSKLSAQGTCPVRIEYLPMLVLNYSNKREERKLNLVISFNNMIVENYVNEEGKHVRWAYIPDYSMVIDDYDNFLKKNSRAESIARLHGNLPVKSKTTGQSHGSMLMQPDISEQKKEVQDFIMQTAEEVKDKLLALGFERVIPVPMKQYRTQSDRGPSALHCRTKVIERDLFEVATK